MSKKNLAKRLIALVAIVAMFAAMTVTASAADEPAFESTTVYSGNETVTVTTTVTGLTAGDQVTYYAKNSSSEVYVNQYTATGATLSESYKANLEDVSGLEINMAKVDETFDNYAKIDGSNVEGFSIVMDNKVVYSNGTAPAIDDIVYTNVSAVNAEGNAISSLKATYNNVTETVKVFVVDGKVAIVNPFDFSGVTGIIGVDLTDAVYGYEYATENFGFNYVNVHCEADYTEEDVTGNLIAVLYTATVPADASEIGIEITKENGEALDEPKKLEALGVLGSTEPKFAIGMVMEGLTSIEYAPYYIEADNTTVVYGTTRVDNFEVDTPADAE